MIRNSDIASCLLLAALTAASGVAHAQGAAFGGAKKKPAASEDDIDAQNGLESATPTDNVNEIGNTGGNPAPPGGGNGDAIGDFPASDDASDFDLNDGGGSGGDGVFNNAPVNVGNNAKGGKGGKGKDSGDTQVSAFGDDATGSAAKPGNAALGNAALGKGAPNNAKPNDNAEALMKQVNGAQNTPPPSPANAVPANAASNPAPAPNPANAAPAAASKPATGQEGLVPKAPADEAPPIEAPPLPPPNEFAGAPPVPGTMRIMADGEAPEEYNVEPGDTLYDICEQLLDEPGYWPKLWALNPEIKNPHFIFPNMRLRFYPGDDETPPYLQVVTEDDTIPIDKGDLDEEELIAEKVIFSDKHLEDQVTEVVGDEGVEALQDEILMGGKVYDGSQIEVQVPGFIYSDEKDAAGYVLGGRNSEISMGPGVQALIESSSGVSPGTLYTVLRKGEVLENPDTGDSDGYKYYFIANMRVERNIGDDLFVGTVQDSRLAVLPEDILVSYISTRRFVPIGSGVGPLASTDAYVVGFEYYSQETGGGGQYVFIDKGNGDGVAPGMYVPIFSTPGYLSSAFGSSDLPVDYQYIGVMRIIDATEAGAVGYVVKNTQEIRLGDRTSKS